MITSIAAARRSRTIRKIQFLEWPTTRYSSSSSGDGDGTSPGGFFFPCRRPPELSGSEGDWRGFICGPFCGGANLADGDCLAEGESSGSSCCCRGEIKEWGVLLDLGDAEGRCGAGDGDTSGFGVAAGLGGAGGVVTFGGMEGTTAGVGLVPIHVVVLIHENEPLARSFSMAAAVSTSPSLKPPSDFFAGSVAVGTWPTGIGS